MNITRLGAVLALGIAVSGCATIIEGTTENISVKTVPADGAQCTLKNSEGTWYVTTPGSVAVHKTKNDLTVDCTKEGFEPAHEVAASHFGATTAANVIAGGVIGMGVDAASGANYSYNSPIIVEMKSVSTSSTGQPPQAAASKAEASANSKPSS